MHWRSENNYSWHEQIIRLCRVLIVVVIFRFTILLNRVSCRNAFRGVLYFSQKNSATFFLLWFASKHESLQISTYSYTQSAVFVVSTVGCSRLVLFGIVFGVHYGRLFTFKFERWSAFHVDNRCWVFLRKKIHIDFLKYNFSSLYLFVKSDKAIINSFDRFFCR